MTYTLPEAVRQGLEQARKISLHRGGRLCVHDGEEVYRIRRFWADGLSIDARHGDSLRGRVEVYDGSRHLYQALIVGGTLDGEEAVFDIKWLHPVTETAPLDYAPEVPVPAGLIARA